MGLVIVLGMAMAGCGSKDPEPAVLANPAPATVTTGGATAAPVKTGAPAMEADQAKQVDAEAKGG